MKICNFEGCDRKAHAKGLCTSHYGKMLRSTQPKTALEKCKIEGCLLRISTDGYCNKHYHQIKKHGHVLERTIFDPNKFVIDGNICKIFIYDTSGKESIAIIDAEDVEKVKGYKWGIWGGYVGTGNWNIGTKNKRKFLHWVIMGKKWIDHKDRDKLNNRKENLRQCTHAQNMMNTGIQSNNTSGYKGVSFDIENNKWMAQIVHNRKRVKIGRFIEKHTAAIAYNRAAEKYHGEFANLNVVTIPINEVIHESN